MEKRIAIGFQERTVAPPTFANQLRRYRRLVFAYWWILVAPALLGIGIQWFVLRRTPRSFTSTGRMIVNVKLTIPSANTYSEELNNFFGTQVELMRSSSVITRVNLRLQSMRSAPSLDPVEISVSLIPKTSIFDLSATGIDPDYTQAYLETTMEEYVKLKRELVSNASTVTRSRLQEESARLESELERSKETLLGYQSTNSVVFLQQSGGNNAAEYLATLSRQVTERKSELQLLKTLSLDENLERQQWMFSRAPANSSPSPPIRPLNSSSSPESVLSSTFSPNPAPGSDEGNPKAVLNTPPGLAGFEAAYLQAKQQVLLLKTKRAELNQHLRPKHPDMIELNEEISRQEKLLEILAQQNQDQLKNREHTIEVQIKDLEEQISAWEKKAVEVSKKLSDFDVLKDNYKRLQTMHDQLQATLQSLDVDKGVGQESVTIFEPATPSLPAPQKFAKPLVLAGMVGLVFGVGILLLLNLFDDRAHSVNELEDHFHEPVFGQIPLAKVTAQAKSLPILQLNEDRHALAEAYSNLRSALLFKDGSEAQPKSIAIASAVPRDGKSTVCASLAVVFAQAGARVLLVDADLRRGVMHKHFATSASPGLSEVLQGKCACAEGVVATHVPNLDLLPCGQFPRRPADLFITQTAKLLKEVSSRYDYILFDTAPVLAADDVANLAPQLDGLIMVVRAGQTSGRLAKAALDLLYLRKVKVLGLVLNGLRPNRSDYRYYQYQEYHLSHPAA